MAVLQEQTGGQYDWFDLSNEELQPEGMFQAKIIAIEDRFGVEMPRYNNPQEIEKVDMTCFLFGYRDADGKPHRISTKPMRIPKLSARSREKSNLIKLLRGILGREPAAGWDYCELKGQDTWIEVGHETGEKTQSPYAVVRRCMTDAVARAEIGKAVAAAKALATVAAPAAAVAPAPIPPANDENEEIPF